MARYVLTRVAQLVPTLLIASVVVFLVIQASPGDPASIHLGREATEAQLAVERQRLGLDQPLPIRYAIWLRDAITLDLGRSFRNNQPVTGILLDAFGYTFRLALAAFAIAVSLGFLFGTVAGLRRGKPVDLVVSTMTAILLSLPSFVIGTILILVFAVSLRWLPPSGAGARGDSIVDSARYLILPALALGLPFAAVITRFLRGALIEALDQDYIRTARSKGLPSRIVVTRHALGNAIIPTVTVAGIQLGVLLAGAVVTETVFSYPGLGRLIVQSIFNRDYSVVQGGLLLAAAILLFLSLMVDLAYGLIDPRIRAGETQR